MADRQTTVNIALRPRGFDEIIGLEKQVAEIRAAIASGRIPRAWILSGPFGCGKTTLADLIAKAVQGALFTGEPQVQEINAASVRGIDAMRRIAESAATYPMVGDYNVIILDEAHQLSKDAKQLLLKEFEAPSAPTVWIICTTNPEKLGTGILAGRCTHIVVAGMGAAERRQLVERAAVHVGFTGDIVPFLTALTRVKITSPRKVLMAFESFVNGGDADRAVQGAQFTEAAQPAHFEIAIGVIYGNWSKKYKTFLRDAGGLPREFEAVADQLKALEESLAKAPKEDSDSPASAAPSAPTDEGDANAVTEETQEGKPEAAKVILSVLAALLKNKVYKGDVRAAECLKQMVSALPTDPALTALVWPCMVSACFKINQYLNPAK